MAPPYTGGCVCGATRYRLTAEPLTLYACHCTDCQKRSGSAFGLSMWVHRGALELTLRPGTLDDTSWLVPVAHIWTRSALPWFRFPEGVPTYEKQPADVLELARLWQSRRRM